MFSLSASALNHLLNQSDWALQRLARFAGKTARFHIAPFSFAYTIQDDGTVRVADESASAEVSCNISPSLLPRLALHDEAAFSQRLAGKQLISGLRLRLADPQPDG